MKKHFVTGLVILLPLAVTIGIIAFIVNILTKPFIGLMHNILETFSSAGQGFWFLTGPQVLEYGGKLLILIMLFVFTVLLGFLGRIFLIHSLLKVGEFILHKIPVVNTIYKTTQDVIKTIFHSRKDSFRQVVMVTYPHTNTYAIGFITEKSPKECQQKTHDDLISVFIPTTPNPTSGYLLMYKKSDIIYLDMKVEEAVKFIISCGVIRPECIGYQSS
jgi:uncharacterized membrane protein